MDRYVLLHDIGKVTTRMDSLMGELSEVSVVMDAAELQRRVKYVAAAVGDLAKIVMDLIEASDMDTLGFELAPELSEPVEPRP